MESLIRDDLEDVIYGLNALGSTLDFDVHPELGFVFHTCGLDEEPRELLARALKTVTKKRGRLQNLHERSIKVRFSKCSTDSEG